MAQKNAKTLKLLNRPSDWAHLFTIGLRILWTKCSSKCISRYFLHAPKFPSLRYRLCLLLFFAGNSGRIRCSHLCLEMWTFLSKLETEMLSKSSNRWTQYCVNERQLQEPDWSNTSIDLLTKAVINIVIRLMSISWNSQTGIGFFITAVQSISHSAWSLKW